MEKTETPYTETEALLAVLNDDKERLAVLVDEMTTPELRTFATSVNRLSHTLYRAYTNREGYNTSYLMHDDGWQPPKLKDERHVP